MADYTDEMLYLLFGLPALFLAFVLFMLGPLGWFTAAFLLLGTMVVKSVVGADDDVPTASGNCSACGSPLREDDAVCDYCGKSVPASAAA